MNLDQTEKLRHYVKKIKRYAEEAFSEEKLLQYLARLEKAELSISSIQESNIENIVSSLALKKSKPIIAEKSQELVSKWWAQAKLEKEKKAKRKENGHEMSQDDALVTLEIDTEIPVLQADRPTAKTQVEQDENRIKQGIGGSGH